MDLNKFETTPSAVLNDITNSPKPETAAEPSAKGSTTIDEVFKANSNTKTTPLSIADNPNGQPTTATQPIAPGSSVALGAMLEGKLAIELIDALIPALFVAALYAVNVKLRKTDLQLTQKEKEVITPIMQQCLNTIMLNFNSPWTTLAVTMGVIYGSKVTEKGFVNWIDKLNEKKEQEALEEKTGLKVASINREPTPVLKENKFQNESAMSIQKAVNEQPLFQENAKPYGEKEIKYLMKRRSIGRDRAIKVLDKQHGLNTIQ
jgi:hypothetical protein